MGRKEGKAFSVHQSLLIIVVSRCFNGKLFYTVIGWKFCLQIYYMSYTKKIFRSFEKNQILIKKEDFVLCRQKLLKIGMERKGHCLFL